MTLPIPCRWTCAGSAATVSETAPVRSSSPRNHSRDTREREDQDPVRRQRPWSGAVAVWVLRGPTALENGHHQTRSGGRPAGCQDRSPVDVFHSGSSSNGPVTAGDSLHRIYDRGGGRQVPCR